MNFMTCDFSCHFTVGPYLPKNSSAVFSLPQQTKNRIFDEVFPKIILGRL